MEDRGYDQYRRFAHFGPEPQRHVVRPEVSWERRTFRCVPRPQLLFRPPAPTLPLDDAEFDEAVEALIIQRAIETEAADDVLRLVLLFSGESEPLWSAFHAEMDAIAESTGRRCDIAMAGDPRHSDEAFLETLDQLGLDAEPLRAGWSAHRERWGDADRARRHLDHAAAVALKVPLDQRPCVVFSTPRLLPRYGVFPLPYPWWGRPELARQLVRRFASTLTDDYVARILENVRGLAPDRAIEVLKLEFNMLEDGINLAEAWGLDDAACEVLAHFQKNPSARLQTEAIANEVGIPQGTLGRSLRHLVNLGLLQNRGRSGYRITDLGRRFVLDAL